MRRIFGIVAASAGVLLLAAAATIYWLLSGDGIRNAIEQQAGAWLGQPVSIASARVTFWPRIAIGLRQVGIGSPPRVRLAEVDLAASALALLSRRVEDAEIRIRNSRVELPLQAPLLIGAPGTSTATPGASGTATSPPESTAAGESSGFLIVSVSSIVLDDVVVASLGRELKLSGRSELAGSRLLVRELTAESGTTSIRSTGTVTFEPRVDADLRVEANRLDVDELLALAGAFLPRSADTAAAGPPARLKAEITADAARAAGVDARRFAGTMAVEGDRVALSPLSFELFGGRYTGSIQARLGSPISATLRASIEGVDVAQVAAFGDSPGTVSGRLAGDAIVTGTGQDLSAILANARGSGSVEIADGTISRLGLVRSIVLFLGRPEANAPPSTDRFDRIDARFELASGNLRATSVSLRSPDVDGTGAGSLNLNTTALNGRMNVALSETLSRQAGTDLRRFTVENNRVVVPVALGGTIDAPSVTIDAAAALQRGLRNESERQLKGLIDRFFK